MAIFEPAFWVFWGCLLAQPPLAPQTLEPDAETQELLSEVLRQAPRLNPNHATVRDLLRLPYISENVATQIYLEARRRPFRDFQDLARRIPLTPIERWVLWQTLVFQPQPPVWQVRFWARWSADAQDTLFPMPEGWGWIGLQERVLVGWTWPEPEWVIGTQSPQYQVWLGTLEPRFGLGLLDSRDTPYALRWAPRPEQRFRLLRGTAPAIGIAWTPHRTRSLWLYGSRTVSVFHARWQGLGTTVTREGVTADLSGQHGPIRAAVELGIVQRRFRYLLVLRSRTEGGRFQLGAGNTGIFAASMTFRLSPGWTLTSDHVLDDAYSRMRSGITLQARAHGVPMELLFRHTTSGPLGTITRKTLTFQLRWTSGVQQELGITHVTAESGPGDVLWLGLRVRGLTARVAIFRVPHWDARIYWMEPEPGAFPRWRSLYGTGRLALLAFQTVIWQTRVLVKGVGIQSDRHKTWELRWVVYRR